MTQDELLDYEIALVLARHGEKRVIDLLARKVGMSPEALQQKLTELRRIKPRSTSRKPVDATRIVESLSAENPEKAAFLRTLFTRFQNRTFLPELKDVRQFFERHSETLRNIKSRTETTPRLFKLLSTLETSDLAGLCQDERRGEYSSLGIISEEIMRRS